MRKTWETQQGKGERILGFIGAGVMMNNRFSPSLRYLEGQDGRYSARAEPIIFGVSGIIAGMLDDGGSGTIDTREVVNMFDDTERQRLLLAYVSRDLVFMANRSSSGFEIGCEGEKAELQALASGLVVYEQEVPVLRLRRPPTRPLEEGEIISGKVLSLHSQPDQGGVLNLSTGKLDGDIVSVSGLVSPETGEPQVTLELLAKTA